MAIPGRGVQLSRREREVAALVAEGLTDQEIADRLFLSRRTAEGHVQAIRNKLGLDNRAQVAAWFARQAGAPDATVTGARFQLPAQLTSFVGRERDLDGLRQALGRARAVTITGPGGAGKTRLAVRAAEEVRARFSGGAWFVDLAALTDGDAVLPAVALALSVREEVGADLPAAIGARLGAGPDALLILDNCEHLVEACAAAAESLLRASSRLRLLATSREPLLFDGELVWKLPPLAVPEAGAPAEAVARSEAAQLLCDRAALSDPGFQLGDGNAGAVAELCRRLDGIPLALELAAAQVGSLGLEGVVARLGERLDFLFRRAAPARHQTLAAAMRWSYDLLDERERTLFRRLAVFRGSFSDEAAAAICGTAAEALPALAAKSLLMALPERRWRMLEVVRAFAQEMLGRGDEATASQAAHLAHYARLAERAAEDLVGPGQAAALDLIEGDHDNLRAAVAAAHELDSAVELRLVTRLSRFWAVRGHLTEARVQLEAALGARSEDAAARAQALNHLAGIAWRQGDYARAREGLEESLAAWQTLGDTAHVQPCLANLGVLAAAEGDFQTARTRYSESLALARQAGDAHAVAVLESNLGLAAAELGDHGEAGDLLEHALAALRRLDDTAAAGSTLVNQGLLALYRGRPDEAQRTFEAALAELEAVGDTPDVASCLEGLGWAAAQEGRDERAVRLAAAAAAIRDQIGAPASPAARARLERWLPAARDALGAGAGAAWEGGRLLTPHEAIDLARGVGA